MYSSKFKNTGNFATSAMVTALVIGMHVAGVHLVVADQEATYQSAIASEASNVVEPTRATSVIRFDRFVVTASRLKA